MTTRITNKSLPFALLLLVGSCASQLDAPAPGTQAAALDGATSGLAYEHNLQRSRFDVGDRAVTEVDGPIVRIRGKRGVFAVDRTTRAVLAVPTAVSQDQYPEPLSQRADEHTSVARDYLIRAGVPAAEVSGTHVTTTMAGGGSMASGEPLTQRLLWYSTHLERSVGGIPVESSFAYTALDSSGAAISEGVYWPALSSDVVLRAQQLSHRLGSPAERAKFLEATSSAYPEISKTEGKVTIVHSSAGYQGRFEAHAVYSVIVRGPMRGKAKILHLDDTGAPLVIDEERPIDSDSAKKL
jgi:hypothetical protein